MFLRDKDKPMISKGLLLGSLLTTLLAIIGAGGYDLYLASTQWLIISILLCMWGTFLLVEAIYRG